MTMKKFAIAVDGPAGSGKSTVAKAVAQALNIIYVDTGAMYRAVAYYCMKKGVKPSCEADVLPLLDEIQLKIQIVDGTQHIFLNGEDVTGEIRTQAIGQGASDVGTIEAVRIWLGQMQADMAQATSVIMDGRDIGTYVLPEAEVKIYLDASADVRATRRVGELLAKGEQAEPETVYREILKRDENDMNRKHRPLRKAEDAVFVDTSHMNIDEVVETILEITQEKLK